MIKGIFFDLDGTLCDTIEDLAVATNYALDKCGVEIHPVDKYRQFVGNGMYKQIERALGVHQQYFDQCLDLFYHYYENHCFDHTLPYKGIDQLVDELSKEYTLAVITNKPHDIAVKICNQLFGDKITLVLGGSKDYPKKPDTTVIDLALNQLDLTSEQCVFVGDSNVDIETAHNASMNSIGCAWGFRGEEELKQAGATKIAYKASDIKEYIDDWNK